MIEYLNDYNRWLSLLSNTTQSTMLWKHRDSTDNDDVTIDNGIWLISDSIKLNKLCEKTKSLDKQIEK